MTLPMLRPALEAVTFGFERIAMMVRLAWLPIALVIGLHVAVGVWLSTTFGVADLAATAHMDTEAGPDLDFSVVDVSGADVGLGLLAVFGLALGSIALFSPVLVAATRAASRSDYEPPSGPAYFVFGPRQVRYVVVQLGYGMLLVTLLAVFGGMAALVGVGCVAAATEMSGPLAPLLGATGVGAAVAITLTGVWIGLRFLPVLAIAAVESRIAFGAAWAMTKGNFWRLLLSGLFFVQILQGSIAVVFIAFVVPVVAMTALLATAISGFVGPAVAILVAIAALVVLPAIIAVAAFTLGAQAAYPGRVYAYLSGCGEDCKIL